MAAFAAMLNSISYFHCSPKIDVKAENQWRPSCAMRSQDSSKSGYSGRSYRQVWRRRKLAKKDNLSAYGIKRLPFLEERVRKRNETGEIISKDIDKLLLSEENKFAFVNEVAAEANQYVEDNPDEYGGVKKKAILHVLSNRMNDYGFYRPDGYVFHDPYKTVQGYEYGL